MRKLVLLLLLCFVSSVGSHKSHGIFPTDDYHHARHELRKEMSDANSPTTTSTATSHEVAVSNAAAATVRMAATLPPRRLPKEEEDALLMHSSVRTRGIVYTGRTADSPLVPTIPRPLIRRKLYPGTVQLKAHSSLSLSDKDPEIFDVVQEVLTPYLEEKLGPSLKAYNLAITYSPGEPVSNVNIVVTNLDVTCTLEVESNSVESFVSVTHSQVREWIREFFSTSELYTLLGWLRRDGIEVNEIVFLEEEFKSGLVNGNTVSSISTGTSGSTSNSVSAGSDNGGNGGRAGFLTAFFIGTFLVAAALFVNYKNRFPSVSSVLISVRESSVVSSIRESLSSDSGSQQSEEVENDKNKQPAAPTRRPRSWSGTWRRFPPTGIRPAALQKKPAFSADYLKKKKINKQQPAESSSALDPPSTHESKPVVDNSTFDEQSYSYSLSVASDYNIPAEYDFKGSPMLDVYTTSGTVRSDNNQSQDEEFSMPDEYSMYGQSVRGYRRDKDTQSKSKSPTEKVASPTRRRVNPFDYGTSPGNTNPRPSSRIRRSPTDKSPAMNPSNKTKSPNSGSPDSGQYIDEWSIDSYSTESPAPKPDSEPPYKPWKDSPNDRSILDIPKLS